MEGFQERRSLEQNERRRQQETFMDATSHEARNPLAAITLCADDHNSTLRALLHEHEDQLVVSRQTAAAVLESIEIIMTCARHQKRIIDDVLTFSKLDSGMLLTCPVAVQPTQVVKQALKMFKHEVKRSDVELGYLICPSYTELAVQWVMLDTTRFTQILINLLNNAIKFTKQGGSGLGLWISKELCAKLGGQIGVASSAGDGNAHGSTFAFYVQAPRCGPPVDPRPLDGEQISRGVHQDPVDNGRQPVHDGPVRIKTPPVSEVPTAGDSTSPPPGISVLVVEDNLINQKVMRKQLLRAGFKVTVANHGKEALEAIYHPTSSPSQPHRHPDMNCVPFDIILMDIEMPVMGGLECTRVLRSREHEEEFRQEHYRLPILGVTANARAEQQAAALDAGMDAVVTKPFHMRDLLGAIESVRARSGRCKHVSLWK